MISTVSNKLDKFFSKYKNQKYKKNEILLRADETPTTIFYLKKGLVKQYAVSKKGEEVVVNIFKEGSFFPISCIMNQISNTYYFEALEPIDVWKAPNKEVLQFIKDNPDVAFDLLSRIYRGIDGLLSRLFYSLAGDAYQKVVIELVIAAKRFGVKNDNNIDINSSEKDLATQSGIARETVSREIKILKQKGIIDVIKNKIIINDLSALESELN